MAENNKLTSLGQLRKLAERALLDSQSRISEVLELMIPLLESAQHTGITVTLPAENWNGRAQTVQDKSFLVDEKYWYIVCADNITVDGQATFRCEVTPVEDLTIYILRLEVEQSNE